MLNELDKELEARKLNFVRYADDCLILVGSEKAANRVMERISKYIEEELGLKVNMNKSKVVKPSDLKYLGFGFYKDSSQYQYKAKPHQNSITRLKLKLKELTKRNWSISLDERLKKIRYLMVGWYNYFKNHMQKYVTKLIDGNLRFRIRMCIWKQWKNCKTRRKALIKLGVTKSKAWEYSNTRKSYARVASSWILCTTITNKRLRKKGLVSLLDLVNA